MLHKNYIGDLLHPKNRTQETTHNVSMFSNTIIRNTIKQLKQERINICLTKENATKQEQIIHTIAEVLRARVNVILTTGMDENGNPILFMPNTTDSSLDLQTKEQKNIQLLNDLQAIKTHPKDILCAYLTPFDDYISDRTEVDEPLN